MLDSAFTPGGCFAAAAEMLGTSTQSDLLPGTAVRFAWAAVDGEPVNGCRFRAYSWYPIDESLGLDEDDFVLLDAEEPYVDDGARIPVTPEEFRLGAGLIDPDAPPIELAQGVVTDAQPRHAPPGPVEATVEFAAISELPAAQTLIGYNPDLVRMILALSSDEQHRLARWCATQALERAGLSRLRWVAPALRALNKGKTLLPGVFHEESVAIQHWYTVGSPSSMDYVRERPSWDPNRPYDNDQSWLAGMALPTIFRAIRPHALEAAVAAVHQASLVFGPDVDGLHSQIIEEFTPSR